MAINIRDISVIIVCFVTKFDERSNKNKAKQPEYG